VYTKTKTVKKRQKQRNNFCRVGKANFSANLPLSYSKITAHSFLRSVRSQSLRPLRHSRAEIKKMLNKLDRNNHKSHKQGREKKQAKNQRELAKV
jgi:hypothetical protein